MIHTYITQGDVSETNKQKTVLFKTLTLIPPQLIRTGGLFFSP